MDFKTERQFQQEIAEAWRMVDQYKRAAEVHAAERDHGNGIADAEIANLRGQAVVLRRLLADCLSVLRSIEPDDTDEAERLENLCAAVALALQPKHEGALL